MTTNEILAKVVSWGDNTYGQAPANSDPYWAEARGLSAGYWHNVAVTYGQNVATWGLNDYGQSAAQGATGVKAVAAGRNHSVLLRLDGTVYAWGDNTYGQTNTPGDLTNTLAVSAGAFHTAAVRSNGTVVCWGYNFYGQCNPPPTLTNAVAVSCGNAFTLALTADGRLVGWGDDFYGQIDFPPNATNINAIAAGGFHALARRGDGSLVAWGYDIDGQAEIPSGLTNVSLFAAGYLHNVALGTNGIITQWGSTNEGQGTAPAVPGKILSLAAGFAHSAALVDDLPFIITQPQNIATNTGKTARFTAQCLATTLLTNRWYKLVGGTNAQVAGNGTSGTTNGVTTATFTIASITASSVAPYYVVLSNPLGSTTSQVATLTIITAPAITAQPQGVITNEGANVTLFAAASGGSLTYRWQKNGLDVGPGDSAGYFLLAAATTNDSGNYRVIITNALGSATSQVASVTIGSSATILNQPSSQAVVLGADASFSIVAGGLDPVSCQWWFNATNAIANATNFTLALPGVQLAAAGNYTAIVSNGFGMATSAVATLTVLIPPNFLSQPVGVTTALSRTVSFTASATGTLPMSAQWWRNTGTTNATVAGGTTTATNGVATFTLTLNVVSGSSAGNYFCAVANAGGTAVSTQAPLIILAVPALTNQPQDAIVAPGDTAVFSATASGGAPLAFQWRFNGAELIGATSNVLQIPNVTTNSAGAYQLFVTNPVGSITSRLATLTIAGSPAILSQPQNANVIQGHDTNFSVTVDGLAPLFYQWYATGTNILVGATNSTLNISSAQTNDSGGYYVVATNGSGSVTSSVATLTVLIPPSVLAQPADVVTNSGATVKFSATYTGTLPLTARWFRANTNGTSTSLGSGVTSGTNGLVTSTVTVPNVTASLAGNYFVTISNTAGSVTSSPASLGLLIAPTIFAQPESIFRNPGSNGFFLVSASGSEPLAFQWLFNGNILTAAASTNYLELNNLTTNDGGQYQVVVSNPVGSATSAVARLTIGFQSYTPAELYLLEHSGTNGDAILMALEAGKNYRVQLSSNTVYWSDLTNFLSTSGLMVYTNVLATNQGAAFYRVVSP